MKIFNWLVLALCLALVVPHDLSAQKEKDPKTEKTEKKPKKEPKEDKGKKDPKGDDKANKDPKNNKDPKATAGPKVVSNTTEDYTGLTREEKNTMTVCPLHNKRMSLSDNYRSNASDFHESEGYPFARQLNYRRSCDHCTKAMIKEEKEAEKRKNAKAGEATFERCEIHNQVLYISDQYHAIDYERYPDAETPHAKQYKFKTYCATCSKMHERAAKDKEKDKEKSKSEK